MRWLWDQRLAIGKLSIVAGDPGLGKSFLTLDLAARVSRDGIMPDGYQGPVGDVVLISAEDDSSDTLRPRLLAAGANTSRVHFVRGALLNPRATLPGAFTLMNLAPLRTVMRDLRPPLIVIDPISAFLGETDSNNNAQVRAMLAPLSGLAGEFGSCVIAVSHLNKASGSDGGAGKAMYRTLGSLAFVAAARSAWLVTRHKTQRERRIFTQIKNNLGRERKAISYTLRPHATMTEQAIVEWDLTELDTDADAAMEDRVVMPGRPDDQRHRAATLLQSRLAGGAPVASSQLFAEATAQGIQPRALERAAQQMNVRKDRPSGTRTTFWSMQSTLTPRSDEPDASCFSH